MPTHAEKRILPYTDQQLFDLVADVKSYPEFLPWCQKSIIHFQTLEQLEADLVVGFGFFQESFSSKVHLTPHQRIDISYEKGPFRYLNNHWVFMPQEKGGCEVDFFIDFEFQNSLFQSMMTFFFTEAVGRMMASFEKRAQALYGISS